MKRLLTSWPVTLVIGLTCGLLTMVLVVDRGFGGAGPVRGDLAAGDVVQSALDAFAAGDHVVVVPGSEGVLSPEKEAELEAVISAEDAPLYVLVAEQSWQSGYRQAGHAFDQMQANATVDGVLAFWEADGSGGSDGYVGLSGDRRLPPSYELAEHGIDLAPGHEAAYDAIDGYEMLGDPAVRLAEWARALPPGIEDVPVETSDDDEGSSTAGMVGGVVTGVLTGLVGALLVWAAFVALGKLARRR